MNDKTRLLFLIVAVLIVIIIGGLAIAKLLRGQAVQKEGGQEKGKRSFVTGREDPRQHFSAEELTYDSSTNKGITPNYQPVLVHSVEGRRLIEAQMKHIMTANPKGYLKLRGKHRVGEKLVNITAFSPEANAAIRKMFGYVTQTDPNNPATYPIYGKYEKQGQLLRQELEAFLALDPKRLHLGQGRHEHAGWLSSVHLNLMMLTTVPRLPSLKTLRGNWATGADREGLINFARINGHEQKHIPFFHQVQQTGGDLFNPIMDVPYKAYGNRVFAQLWLAEMDRLDENIRWEAMQKLIKDGRLIEQPLQGHNDASNQGEKPPRKLSTTA